MSSQATSDPRSAGLQCFVESTIRLPAEEHEPDLLDLRVGVSHGVDRDGRGFAHRVAVRARRDRREGYRRRAELVRDAETCQVASSEELRGIAFAPVDRSDGV